MENNTEVRISITLTATEFDQLAEALYSAERGDRTVFIAAAPAGADIDGVVIDVLALGGRRYSVEYSDHARCELLDGGAAMDADAVLAAVRQTLDTLAEFADLEPEDEGDL